MQLEIEREALRKETDRASKDRLVILDKELADRKESRNQLRVQWEQEKSAIQASSRAKGELDALRHEIEEAQRDGNYARASELQYGRLPQLEQQLAAELAAQESDPEQTVRPATSDPPAQRTR